MLKRIILELSRPYFPISVLMTSVSGFIGIYLFTENAISISISIFISSSILFLCGPAQNIRERVIIIRRLTHINNTYFPPVCKGNIAFAVPFMPLITAPFLWGGLFYVIIFLVFFGRYMRGFFLDTIKRKEIRETERRSFISIRSRIVFYVGGSDDVFYQVNQWLPVLEKLKEKPVVILRNSMIKKKIEPTDIEVYFAHNIAALEWFLGQGTEIILYPNNSEKNVGSLLQSQLTHIFINHGESDKASNQSKILMAYDKIFVAGNLAERRLIDASLPVRPGQIVHVGRPQAEMALEYKPVIDKPRNILYAPTWEGRVNSASYSSVGSAGIELLREIGAIGGFNVKVKTHPLTGTTSPLVAQALNSIRQICDDFGFEFLGSSSQLHDLMNWSDVLICDVSSVLNEYLVTGKPIILCSTIGQDIPREVLYDNFPSSKAAYILDSSTSVAAILDQITVGDVLRNKRAETRVDSMGEGGAFERFESEINLLLRSCPE